jgi:hypothetical protein
MPNGDLMTGESAGSLLIASEFHAMLGMGILQNPMFGDGSPHGLAVFMPEYGASRVVFDGAFGNGFS